MIVRETYKMKIKELERRARETKIKRNVKSKREKRRP